MEAEGLEAVEVEALEEAEAVAVAADGPKEAGEVDAVADRGSEEEAGTEAECLAMPVALAVEG